jgi:hypothetical protein
MFAIDKKSLVSLILLMSLILPGSGQAESSQSDEEMVHSIMELRGDIEALYAKIDGNKERYKAQLKSLTLQIADTEAQINRKNTSIKLAQTDLQQINAKIAHNATETIDLEPLLNDGIEQLARGIKEGIPFKTSERLTALAKIRKELAGKVITQERALALLWASYDDNIRLTKEIGLFKQNIHIDGKDVLANVAKIGTVMMCFSTPDNQVGYVIYGENRYEYQVVQDKDEQKEIAGLFAALNKQIRTGYFSLPNALLVKGGQS